MLDPQFLANFSHFANTFSCTKIDEEPNIQQYYKMPVKVSVPVTFIFCEKEEVFSIQRLGLTGAGTMLH